MVIFLNCGLATFSCIAGCIFVFDLEELGRGKSCGGMRRRPVFLVEIKQFLLLILVNQRLMFAWRWLFAIGGFFDGRNPCDARIGQTCNFEMEVQICSQFWFLWQQLFYRDVRTTCTGNNMVVLIENSSRLTGLASKLWWAFCGRWNMRTVSLMRCFSWSIACWCWDVHRIVFGKRTERFGTSTVDSRLSWCLRICHFWWKKYTQRTRCWICWICNFWHSRWGPSSVNVQKRNEALCHVPPCLCQKNDAIANILSIVDTVFFPHLVQPWPAAVRSLSTLNGGNGGKYFDPDRQYNILIVWWYETHSLSYNDTEYNLYCYIDNEYNWI